MKALLLSGLAMIGVAMASLPAATLVGYDFEDLSGDPVEVAEGVNASAFAAADVTIYRAGTGNPGAAATAAGWNVSPPYGDRFFSFTIAPAAGLALELTGLRLDLATAVDGPRTYRLAFARDGTFGALTGGEFRDGYVTLTLPLAVVVDEAMTFMLYAFDAPSATAPVHVDNIVVEGRAVPEPAVAVLVLIGLSTTLLRRRRA